MKRMAMQITAAFGVAAMFVGAGRADAVLAETEPMVLATEQAGERLVLLSPCVGTNDDSVIRWTWSPKTDPGVKPEDAAKFINPSECKLRDDGRTILVTASEGAFADIDVATGRARAYGIIGDVHNNPHSADRLPDGAYVIASSLGNCLTVLDVKGAELEPSAQRRTTVVLPDAHGVEWDARRNCVWALGSGCVARYSYDSDRKALTLTNTYPLSKIGFGGGHDLVLFKFPKGDRLWLTAHIGGVASLDPDTGEFKILSRMKFVKSISRCGKRWLFVQPTDHGWSDTLTTVSKKDTEKPLTFRLKGAEFYKAKLFQPSAAWRLDRQ